MKPITDPEEIKIFQETFKALYFLDRTSAKAYMDLGKLDVHITHSLNAEILKSGDRRTYLLDAYRAFSDVYASYSDEYSLASWDSRLQVLRQRGIRSDAPNRWHAAYLLFTSSLEEIQTQLEKEIAKKQPPFLTGHFNFSLLKTIYALREPLVGTHQDIGTLEIDLWDSDDHKLPSDFKSTVTDKSLYGAFQAANEHGFIKPKLTELDLETVLGRTLLTTESP